MWKFENFSATYILREFNFGHFRVSKPVTFCIFKALNFDFSEFWPLRNNKKLSNPKFRASQKCQNSTFETSSFSKFVFTKNLSNRKILTFSHCVVSHHSVEKRKIRSLQNYYFVKSTL